jgi:hypothetical protein
MNTNELPEMTLEVATIAANMIVFIDDQKARATYIAIERYVKSGPQWVRLIAEKGDQSCTYLIDRKKMVNAWLHLVKGQIDIESMEVKVNNVQWMPINALIKDIDGISRVILELRSPEGVDQKISIDFDNLVKAYYSLRTNINDLFNDMSEITHSLFFMGNG